MREPRYATEFNVCIDCDAEYLPPFDDRHKPRCHGCHNVFFDRLRKIREEWGLLALAKACEELNAAREEVMA